MTDQPEGHIKDELIFDKNGKLKRKKRYYYKDSPILGSVLFVAIAGLVFAFILKTFIVQSFYVPSASMEPTLMEDDRLLVEKWNGWQGNAPIYGDVIVFEDPGGWLPGDSVEPRNAFEWVLRNLSLRPRAQFLVKRVIGVPGDTIVCCETSGHLLINGKPVDESRYLEKGVAPSEFEFKVTVPEGKYWVMGDNRINSSDSRFYQDDGKTLGFVDEDDVVGKVVILLWPTSRFKIGAP